jgi:hypothetical protein
MAAAQLVTLQSAQSMAAAGSFSIKFGPADYQKIQQAAQGDLQRVVQALVGMGVSRSDAQKIALGQVSSADAQKLLQGLTTSDIQRIRNGQF